MATLIPCKYCLEEFLPNNSRNIVCLRCSYNPSRKRKYKANAEKLEGIYTYKLIIEDHLAGKIILKEYGTANKLMQVVGRIINFVDDLADGA